jgi:hypothetical protein
MAALSFDELRYFNNFSYIELPVDGYAEKMIKGLP